MQTIKTGVVAALLLTVFYGAFVALNAPDPDLPDSMKDWLSENELEQLLPDDQSIASFDSAVAVDPSQLVTSAPSGMSAPPMSTENGLGEMPPLPSDATPFPQAAAEQASRTTTTHSVPSLANNKPQESAAGNSAVPDLSQAPKLEGFPELDSPLTAENLAANPNRSTQGSLQQISGTNKVDNVMTLGYETPSNSPDAGADKSEPRPQPTQAFPVAREQALVLAREGKLKEALAMLSIYFHSPELGYEQRNDLVDILDALCREVIYSKKHLVEQAYKVGPTDTVASVATEFQITPELLNALNGLGESKALLPGSELKVIRGPIDAHVSLSKQELTLFVGELYAGRFPVSFGQDPPPREGSFEVVARELDRTYYASGGNVIQGKDPMNPYGGYWLNLGDDLCIHGTPEMASTDLQQAGCISLGHWTRNMCTASWSREVRLPSRTDRFRG